ncbi:MAG: pyridoxamine 5'-phosphate oxidase family protein [Gemmataceae bacterium]
MVIREMSREECFKVLAGTRLVRLGCAHENQPYVVPVYLAYHEASGCLYGFTTPGQKVEWMRANPLVCVEVDEITANDQWVTIIAMGRYEELPKTPGSDGNVS